MAPETQASPETRRHPTEEEIAQRAHERYLQRGGAAGHEQEDWLQAERELVEEPLWLEEITRAQAAHAVHWEHPWKVDVDAVETDEAVAAFKASLDACSAKTPGTPLEEPASLGSVAGQGESCADSALSPMASS